MYFTPSAFEVLAPCQDADPLLGVRLE